jgi:CRISPR-associated protein Csb1
MHVFERRRIDGAEITCVLIDSVQSQANRLEESLLAAVDAGAIKLPFIAVDFGDAGLPDVGRITSLDAPHRVYDAILRDSLLDGTPFMQSSIGRRLHHAKPGNADALLEVSPTALVFGAWHSQGQGGGIGAKFPRCIVSEIVGINTPTDEVTNRRTGEIHIRTAGKRTGSRIDPLGILKKVEVYKGATGWATTQKEAGKGARAAKPSEINHGNIAPSVQPLGITMEYAEQTLVITLAGLRRLGFGGGDKDSAARTYLASLALVAALEQDGHGYALRSRCDLVPEGRASWEIVNADGTTRAFEVDQPSARTLYSTALKAAKDTGLAINTPALILKPQQKLIDIIKQSQDRALAGEGGEEGAGE